MNVRLLDIAQQWLDEADEYYNSESSGLGKEFLLEALAAIGRIQQFPNAWHPYAENTRRCQTRRFPYGVTYQVPESKILVVAIAHMHRRPSYWRDRIGEDK
jgi:toxin ParE2